MNELLNKLFLNLISMKNVYFTAMIKKDFSLIYIPLDFPGCHLGDSFKTLMISSSTVLSICGYDLWYVTDPSSCIIIMIVLLSSLVFSGILNSFAKKA